MQKLVVVGGGAAGFFCAVNAARMAPQLQVVLLEKTGKLLQKVRISGGGRCNATHHLFDISPLTKCYPRGEKFLKKAFHQFNPAHTVAWFAERGVSLKTEADGRMFPTTDQSDTIINCLLHEADKYKVQVQMQATVKQLVQKQEGWQILLADNNIVKADYVVVATGGFPKPEQFTWLTATTNHTIAVPVPSLFTFNLPGNAITQLMGVATPAVVKIAGTKFESAGPLLITHWGLSGPAILRTSAFAARHLAEAQYIYTVIINWLPAFNENTLRELVQDYRQQKGTQKVINSDWAQMPARLWGYLLEVSGIPADQKWADLPAPLQNRLIKNVCAFEVQAKGKTTFKDEFVTAGGINLPEINPATMESRHCKGLFFAGEIMDVDGITGGFNFQHAWTSAFIAAQTIAHQAA